MTIIQTLTWTTEKLRHIVPFALATLLLACEAKPFNVVAPAFERREGSALVSATIPPFSRGLIQRVEVRVTSAPTDTSRMRTITRNMNFPSPGGNLSVGQVTDILIGLRRFEVRAFDTLGTIRFSGFSDSTVSFNQTHLVQVDLGPIGGRIEFQTILNPSTIDSTVIDSAGIAALPPTSVLDVLELIDNPHHPSFSELPVFSVALGERFTLDDEQRFTKTITASTIPTGVRRFVAHLKDLSSNQTLAFADTISVEIDATSSASGTFNLSLVEDTQTIIEIFTKQTLPPDGSIVVVSPQF